MCSRARVRTDVKSSEDDDPSEAIIVHCISGGQRREP